jgi:hypothetical protein
MRSKATGAMFRAALLLARDTVGHAKALQPFQHRHERSKLLLMDPVRWVSVGAAFRSPNWLLSRRQEDRNCPHQDLHYYDLGGMLPVT